MNAASARGGLLTMLVWLAACGPTMDQSTPTEPAAQGSGAYERSVRVEGLVHDYRLFVPSGIEPGAETVRPLLLSLHGGGSGPEDHDALTGLRETAEAEGFVLATPRGFLSTWNAGSCCGPAAEQAIDHVAVMAAILDDIDAVLPIDATRVYATGHSNGGMMVYRLACELSQRIAAIAPNAATLMDRDLTAEPPAPVFTCAPERAVPVFHSHGLADTCVPFDGGQSTGPEGGQRPPVADSIDFWVDNNRCALPPLRPSYQQGDATCERYSACQDGASVTLCTVEQGGHTWPGVDANPVASTCGGEPMLDLDANALMWTFFMEHPL